MRLSKADRKRHEQAMALVDLERDLTNEEKLFVLNNFREEAVTEIGRTGSFFTSEQLSSEFSWNVTGTPHRHNIREKVVDLCAGIGRLGFGLFERFSHVDLICVELNQTFCRVGKKILPQATWICGSVVDPEVVSQLETMNIDTAISNPPFGNIPTLDADAERLGLQYKGSQAAYVVVELATKVANRATFILPHNCLPFAYSGLRGYKEVENKSFDNFYEATGIEFSLSSVDTEQLIDEDGNKVKNFRNTPIIVEIVDVELSERWYELQGVYKNIAPEPTQTQGQFTF